MWGALLALLFAKEGKWHPIVSFAPCAFWLLSVCVQVGVLPALRPSGASLLAGRFPGCPAGGTHPLNEGHPSTLETLLPQGEGSLITHQPFRLDSSHPGIFGANLREFTNLSFSS